MYTVCTVELSVLQVNKATLSLSYKEKKAILVGLAYHPCKIQFQRTTYSRITRNYYVSFLNCDWVLYRHGAWVPSTQSLFSICLAKTLKNATKHNSLEVYMNIGEQLSE